MLAPRYNSNSGFGSSSWLWLPALVPCYGFVSRSILWLWILTLVPFYGSGSGLCLIVPVEKKYSH
jgi:hypothetical protein